MLRYRYGRRRDMYCQYCHRSTLFDDPPNQNGLKRTIPDDTHGYRQQYLKNNDDQSSSRPTTSYLERTYLSSRASFASGSGSTASHPKITTITSYITPLPNSLPAEPVSRVLSPAHLQLQDHGSVLMRAFSKQIQPI